MSVKIRVGGAWVETGGITIGEGGFLEAITDVQYITASLASSQLANTVEPVDTTPFTGDQPQEALTQAVEPLFVAVGTTSTIATTPVAPGIPAGMTAGDYMVMALYTRVQSPDVTDVTTPAGWTLIGSAGPTGLAKSNYFFGRFWVTGDAAPSITIPNSRGAFAQISGWRYVNATTPLDTTATTAEHVSPEVTTSINTGRLPAITTVTTGSVIITQVAVNGYTTPYIPKIEAMITLASGSTAGISTAGGGLSVGVGWSHKAAVGIYQPLAIYALANTTQTWRAITIALRRL